LDVKFLKGWEEKDLRIHQLLFRLEAYKPSRHGWGGRMGKKTSILLPQRKRGPRRYFLGRRDKKEETHERHDRRLCSTKRFLHTSFRNVLEKRGKRRNGPDGGAA